MNEAARSRTVALVLIFSLILFFSSYLSAQKTPGKGNLIGKIYAKNGITVIEGATVKIKNVTTDEVYESSKTDMLGTFKIEGIEEGLYSVGIVTEEGNFNVESLIGIKANKTVLITLALKPFLKEEDKRAELKSKVLKRTKEASKIVKFFTSTAGLAIMLATTSVIGYGIIKLVEEEKEASPFK